MRSFDEKWAWVLTEQADQHGHDYTCLRKWLNVVETYNVAHLTYESDKLAAIAGLAKYLRDDLWKNDGLAYYAGLWSFDFVTQLLWCTGSDNYRCETYTAPSWSWASTNGRVVWTNMAYDTNSYLTILLEAHCVPVSSALGQVKSGYARLRGPMCCVTLLDTAVRRRSTVLLGTTEPCKRMRCFLALDDRRDAEQQSKLEASCSDTGHDAAALTSNTNQLFALGVVIAENTGGERRAECLVLRPRGRSGQFRRVGVMQCYDEEADDNPLFMLLEALDAMDIPDGLYEDRHEEEATFDINVV